jgi:thiamine biosynthesis protein ThiI
MTRAAPTTSEFFGEAPASAGHAVVVHYHEIGLKGRNRGFFERRLVRNLESALDGCGYARVEVLSGRFLVHTPGPPAIGALAAIASTFGVAAFAPCEVVRAAIDEIADAALRELTTKKFGTFAVAARRATKELPFSSRDINVEVGARIQAATGAAVDLSAPDVTVHCEVVGGRALVYTDRHLGPGGLPVGVSGKVAVLLSGGIDSPVAALRMLKRGARVVACHFHSEPFTDASSSRKARELCRVIAQRQGDTTLFLVPLGDAQQAVVTSAPPDLRVVLYRRLMVRIAGELARREGAKALVSGDSLGQVASQTLENMLCVDDAAPMPVMRPLVGWDKQEIIAEAHALGTYDTSILPFEDCCSLFVPRSPATRASVEECRAAEDGLDVRALVDACVARAQVERVTR